MNNPQGLNPYPISTFQNPPNDFTIPEHQPMVPIQNNGENAIEYAPSYQFNNTSTNPFYYNPDPFNPQNNYPGLSQPGFQYQYWQPPNFGYPGYETGNHPRFCQCNICISNEYNRNIGQILSERKLRKKSKYQRSDSEKRFKYKDKGKKKKYKIYSDSDSESSSFSDKRIISKNKFFKYHRDSDSESYPNKFKLQEKWLKKGKKKYKNDLFYNDHLYNRPQNNGYQYLDDSSDDNFNNYKYHNNDFRMFHNDHQASNYKLPYKYIPYATQEDEMNRIYHKNSKMFRKHPKYLGIENPYSTYSRYAGHDHFANYPTDNYYGIPDNYNQIYPTNRHFNHKVNRSKYDRFIVNTENALGLKYEDGYWPGTGDKKFTTWNEIINTPKMNNSNKMIKQAFTKSSICNGHLHSPENYTYGSPHLNNYNYYHECYPSNLREEKIGRRYYNSRPQIFHH